MPEEDLGLQLEEWEISSEEKQDPIGVQTLPVSTMEESLLFESKNQ